MTFEDAVNRWQSNDEWEFADREAERRFFYQEGMRIKRSSSIAPLVDSKTILQGAEAAMRCKMFCKDNPLLQSSYAVLALTLEDIAMRLDEMEEIEKEF